MRPIRRLHSALRASLAAALFLFVTYRPLSAQDLLPSRELRLPPFAIDGTDYVNFDLFDARQAMQHPPRIVAENAPRSIFVRRHLAGIAVAGDGGAHTTSVGFYLTVAEWERMNLGVPSVEFGFGRYPVYDAISGLTTMKQRPTLIISLASIHYHVLDIRPWGLRLYMNFEQVHDIRQSFTGSQLGITFSK